MNQCTVSAHFNNVADFVKECDENHMRLQEETDDKVIALYGDEYMGYFNHSTSEGFLLLESMAVQPQSMLH